MISIKLSLESPVHFNLRSYRIANQFLGEFKKKLIGYFDSIFPNPVLTYFLFIFVEQSIAESIKKGELSRHNSTSSNASMDAARGENGAADFLLQPSVMQPMPGNVIA